MAIKRTSLYIDEELLKDLKILSVEQGKKVNDLIIEFIKKELENIIPKENI